MSPAAIKDFIKALDTVWKQKEGQAEQEANRTAHRIEQLNNSIRSQVVAAIDPGNASIKQEILAII